MTNPDRGAIRRPPAALILPLLGGTLLLALVAAVGYGQVAIPPGATVQILLNHAGLGQFPRAWQEHVEVILLTVRLPRALAAALVGAALATAGALFQGMLRNPLADPYVVGTSGGAALGAVIGMLIPLPGTFLGLGVVPLAAFVGALGTTLLVVQLSTVGGRLPVVTVLLSGFAVSTLMGYAGTLLLVLNDRMQLKLARVYYWLLGRVPEASWEPLAVTAPLVLLGVAGSLALARSLNALSLGEEGAARLGVPVEREKRLMLGLGALLTAGAVSVSGLVGFVGLVVPHGLRLICGPDHRVLLPASAVGGAAFLVLADLIARTVARPAELPLGVVTAFLGGPLFLWLLRRSRREYEM